MDNQGSDDMENIIKKIIPLLTILLVSCACKDIKYESDLGFMNSAQANSMEYMVKINSKVCKDLDGKVGLCATRVKTNEPLRFEMDAREYGYRFNLTCTSSIDSDFSIDIEKEKPFAFSIHHDKFSSVKSFTCIGEVFPHDRNQEVSANFSVRAIVTDSLYLEREIIYKTKQEEKSFLVLGKHARYVHLNDSFYKKKTKLELEDQNSKAYSESERMRFNYWGY